MDDALLGNETKMSERKDSIEAFLLHELEHARSSLTSEREMANGMVNHFFTLVIASMGGFVYLVAEKKEQMISWYVLLVGLILLVLGLSVIVRLIKRHFDGEIFQKGREELYNTIKTLHEEPLLCSYYQTIDNLNKKVAGSPWFEKYMGVGFPIALVNCLLAVAVFRYSYYFAAMPHFPCWIYVLVELLFIVILLWLVFFFRKNKAINFAIGKSLWFVLRENFFRIAVIAFMLLFVAVFFRYRYRYVNAWPFFHSYAVFGGLLAFSFQVSIYFRKKHVVDAALKV